MADLVAGRASSHPLQVAARPRGPPVCGRCRVVIAVVAVELRED